ncbi:MAG: hypothetical protein ACRCVT_07740 [Leadbetterella sp.]
MSKNNPVFDSCTIYDPAGVVHSRERNYTQVLRLTKDFGKATIEKTHEPNSQYLKWENGYSAIVLWK